MLNFYNLCDVKRHREEVRKLMRGVFYRLFILGVSLIAEMDSYGKSLITHSIPRISVEYPVQVSFSLESYTSHRPADTRSITVEPIVRTMNVTNGKQTNEKFYPMAIDIQPNEKHLSLTILDGDFLDSSIIQLFWLAPFQLSEGVFELERNYIRDPFSEVSTCHWQIVGKIEVKKVNQGQKFAFQDKLIGFPVDTRTLEYRIRFTEKDGSVRYSIPHQIKLY